MLKPGRKAATTRAYNAGTGASAVKIDGGASFTNAQTTCNPGPFGYQARLTGTLTASRNYTCPYRAGSLASTDVQQKAGNPTIKKHIKRRCSTMGKRWRRNEIRAFVLILFIMRAAEAETLTISKGNKMLTISVEEILNAQQAFQALVNNSTIAAAIKLRLLPITRSFDQHVKDINDVRFELFKKHGTPLENDPQNFEIKPENKEAQTAMANDWKAVLAETRTIPGKKLKFENISGVSLSTVDLMNLEWLIEFPEDAETELPAEAAAKAAA